MISQGFHTSVFQSMNSSLIEVCSRGSVQFLVLSGIFFEVHGGVEQAKPILSIRDQVSGPSFHFRRTVWSLFRSTKSKTFIVSALFSKIYQNRKDK